MKESVNFSRFCDAFVAMDRNESFSYEGKRALFDYIEEMESDTAMEIELDVIALCCEFSEFDNIEELQKDYGDEYQTIEDIEDATTVIPVSGGGFIIVSF